MDPKIKFIINNFESYIGLQILSIHESLLNKKFGGVIKIEDKDISLNFNSTNSSFYSSSNHIEINDDYQGFTYISIGINVMNFNEPVLIKTSGLKIDYTKTLANTFKWIANNTDKLTIPERRIFNTRRFDAWPVYWESGQQLASTWQIPPEQ